jgi:hypothetical protein
MKVLIDECASRALKQSLAAHGHESLTALRISIRRAPAQIPACSIPFGVVPQEGKPNDGNCHEWDGLRFISDCDEDHPYRSNVWRREQDRNQNHFDLAVREPRADYNPSAQETKSTYEENPHSQLHISPF